MSVDVVRSPDGMRAPAGCKDCRLLRKLRRVVPVSVGRPGNRSRNGLCLVAVTAGCGKRPHCLRAVSGACCRQSQGYLRSAASQKAWPMAVHVGVARAVGLPDNPAHVLFRPLNPPQLRALDLSACDSLFSGKIVRVLDGKPSIYLLDRRKEAQNFHRPAYLPGK